MPIGVGYNNGRGHIIHANFAEQQAAVVEYSEGVAGVAIGEERTVAIDAESRLVRAPSFDPCLDRKVLKLETRRVGHDNGVPFRVETECLAGDSRLVGGIAYERAGVEPQNILRRAIAGPPTDRPGWCRTTRASPKSVGRAYDLRSRYNTGEGPRADGGGIAHCQRTGIHGRVRGRSGAVQSVANRNV